jgi:TP901 family phage tail tape measure protein
MSFENAMSSVAAISGATGTNFESLSKKAKEMGASTKYTATEAANAMEYMAMAGWKTADMLSGIDGIMNLAAASGSDLARTSDIVTDALTAFGKQAKDSGEFADVLAAASANANTNVDLMGETFKYVGSVAGAMGYSIQDISLATGLMANSSIKGSAAGTALRSTITRMAKPTEESSMAMSALGLSLTDTNGNMNSFGEVMKDMRKGMQGMTEDEKASYAAMLGGQEAMSGLLAIANASDEDFNKLSDAINNAAGSAEKMAGIKMDNLQGAVDELKSGMEGLGITAFEQASESLKGFVENATSVVNNLNQKLSDVKYIEKAIQWIQNLGSAFKDGGLEGGLKEIGGLLDGTGEKVKALGAVLGALGIVTKASDFFQGNTWKLVSMGIGGINGTLKEVPQWAKNAGKSIGKAFSNSKLGGILQSAVGKIKNPFKDILDAATLDGANGIQKIGALGGKVVQTVTSTVQTVGKLIFGVGSKMFSGLTQIMGLAMKALMPAALIAVVLAGLGLLYQTFGSQIDSILQLAQTRGPQFITNLVNGITSRLPELIQQGGHLVSELLDTITANLPALIAGGVTLVQSLVSGLISALPELIPSAVNMVTTLITGIASALPQLIMTGMQLLLALAQGIIGAIPQLLKALPQVLSAMIDTIMATDWLEVGKQVVLAIGEGIFGGLSKLGGKIGKFFGNISDWCAGGEKGGKSVTSGTVSGINAGSSQVSSAANSLGNTAASSTAAGIQAGIGSVAASAGSVGDTAISALTAGISNGNGTLLSAGTNAGAAVTEGMDTGLTTLNNVASTSMSNFSGTISSSGTKAVSSAKNVSKAVNAALKTTEPAALRSGQGIGNNMANGIRSKNSAVTSASRALANAAKTPISNINTYSYGAYIGMGLANGMASQVGHVRAVAAQLAAAAEAAIRAKAQIHSPSRVADKLGNYFGIGWINGIMDHVQEAKQAAMELIQIPELTPAPEIGMSLRTGYEDLNDSYQYSSSGKYTIYVPVNLDGREIGKATATYTREEIEKQETRENRKKGRRMNV